MPSTAAAAGQAPVIDDILRVIADYRDGHLRQIRVTSAQPGTALWHANAASASAEISDLIAELLPGGRQAPAAAAP